MQVASQQVQVPFLPGQKDGRQYVCIQLGQRQSAAAFSLLCAMLFGSWMVVEHVAFLHRGRHRGRQGSGVCCLPFWGAQPSDPAAGRLGSWITVGLNVCRQRNEPGGAEQ